ncbi:MAG: pantetheine-phosphate adenylyltransferase [Nitrospirota bacterium]|nr:pantetheine-phosphate adenylyltransferase [Nitrospirota bacterium]MDH5768195.1 pantetheine-phosphate adenylyltransferase [Nitrospirota bacterium]
MKKAAVYPGTFDPFTIAHLEIVKRGLRIFDEIIIAVAPSKKKQPLFNLEERLIMITKSVEDLDGVRVEAFNGLLADYVRDKKGVAIIRGLRAVSDFEYEMQMAMMNRRLNAEIETVFLMPSEEYSFLTSTSVKEVASFGGPVKGLVPEVVEKALIEKFR